VKKRLSWRRLGREERAAQMVEFAVTLPLLVVFVVGIFDFSGAFTLKQKLTNAARDAARVAAAEPINDINAALPMSVKDAFWTIDNYLQKNQINDCAITSSASTAGPPTWVFESSGGGCSSAGLKITIDREYYFPAATSAQPATVTCTPQAPGSQTAVIATCVSIQYGYQWKFGNVATLLGGTPLLPGAISAVAVAMNEN
jgi:Flp pilus assembly protein TadG